MAYHDEHVRKVKSKLVQVDEAWSFIYAKQKNVATAKAAPEGAGDVWTWVALDADRKLAISYFVGGRDGECCWRSLAPRMLPSILRGALPF
jgi:hypothetical protein